MQKLDRRQWMRCATAAAIGASFSASHSLAGTGDAAGRCTLSIGTYAMPGMRVEEAIRLVAETGYDGIEIAARADYDGAPGTMSPTRRKEVHQQLRDRNLKLTALMENLYPTEKDAEHAGQVERLKRVGELANDLATGGTPPVQTTLGGGVWAEKKTLFRDRLGDWIDALREAGVVLAIKPHRGGGMSRPDEAVWLIRQFDETPWLRMVYDYSHYAFRDMTVEETVAVALPYTAHIAVKDAVKQGDRVVFQLPGTSGTFDYAHLLRLFYEGGYRADICCEVSGMVWKSPGYDPAEAARVCYRNVARAFEKAEIPRVREG